MSKTFSLPARKIVIAFGLLLTGMLFALTPQSASAAVSPNAFLGGGNALARATTGQSQGLTHANSASELLAHLTAASTRGGRSEELPPPQNDAEGNSSADTGNSVAPGGQEGGAPEAQSLPDQANENATNNANGGAQGGNGGDGGNSTPGGLVRAGSVVSSAIAVNVINTNIIRIGSR